MQQVTRGGSQASVLMTNKKEFEHMIYHSLSSTTGRRHRLSRLYVLDLLALSMLASCAPDAPINDAEHEVEDPSASLQGREEALYGRPSYQSDCTAPVKGMIQESLKWGRITSNSAAFSQCITGSFQSGGTFGIAPYRKCVGDPFYSSTAATQAARAIDASRSFTDVTMACTGGEAGNAVAWLGAYAHSSPDSLSWNGPWVSDMAASLSNPLCGASPTPLCRGGAYPWPYTQLAGIIWHEVAHTNGYTHGANDQAGALTACGYAGDPTWHFQNNTAPYIIQNCISSVLDQSWQQCGDPKTGCAAGEFRLVGSHGGNTCACVKDPGWDVIGGAAGNVYVGGYGTFATFPGNGHILRYSKATGTWTDIGGPGLQFAVNDNALFTITPDGQQVWQYNGSYWVQIGGLSNQLIAAGSELYSVYPPTGDIYRYNGSAFSWTYIGGPRLQFAANDSDLYARSATQVFKYSGTPGTWNVIGGGSDLLVAGGTGLYSVYPPTKDIYQYNKVSNTWAVAGGPALRFAANRKGLYGQSTDGLAIYRLPPAGGTWERIGGGSISALFAGGDSIVARHTSGDLMSPVNP